jgi:hypothetical protein
MTLVCKNMEELTPDDYLAFPVWEFALDMEDVDDLAMRPVAKLPVDDLANRLVGTKVHLANGDHLWASLSNIKLDDSAKTRRILAAAFYLNGEWIYLARPQDPNQENYGPAALARKIGLPVDQVFPISYDVSKCCIGDENAIRGLIESGLR